MKKIEDPLHQEDWLDYFASIGISRDKTSSNHPFYYNLLQNNSAADPELTGKMRTFHQYYFTKPYQTYSNDFLSAKWATYFAGDFNLKDYPDILLMKSYHGASRKETIKWLEKNYDKKSIFLFLTDFIAQHKNDKVLNLYWLGLLEKKNFPVEKKTVLNIAQHAFNDMILPRTNDLTYALKFRVLYHQYAPDETALIEFVKQYSGDAIFFDKAKSYLAKKNIDIALEAKNISMVKKESFFYEIKLDPEYFISHHQYNRAESEKFIKAVSYFLSQSFPNDSSYTDRYRVYCESIEDYKTKKIFLESMMHKIDIVSAILKNDVANTHEYNLSQHIAEKIETVARKQQFETSLPQKDSPNIHKKQKI